MRNNNGLSNNGENPFGINQKNLIPLNNDDMKKLLNEIFKDPIFKEDAESPNDNNFASSLSKVDRWCNKVITENPKAKRWTSSKYPYKDYTSIDTFLRKYGKEYIKHLLSIYPKGKHGTDLDSLYDSVAFIIYKRKLDPKSLFEDSVNLATSNMSIWKKISDKSHV